jgi:inorganic pyrophosphatase
MVTDPLHLPPFDSDDADTLHVIIDTPKGSRNKFEWDKKHGLYKLGGILAAGAFFPYDFGFVPSTLADDGDAIDVLVLMEEPAFVGCLVPSRLIGGFSCFLKLSQVKRNAMTACLPLLPTRATNMT